MDESRSTLRRVLSVLIAIAYGALLFLAAALLARIFIARGHGYLFNYVKYYGDFAFTRDFLLIFTACAIIWYARSREKLSTPVRLYWFTCIAGSLALIAENWIIIKFAATPYWGTD